MIPRVCLLDCAYSDTQAEQRRHTTAQFSADAPSPHAEQSQLAQTCEHYSWTATICFSTDASGRAGEPLQACSGQMVGAGMVETGAGGFGSLRVGYCRDQTWL